MARHHAGVHHAAVCLALTVTQSACPSRTLLSNTIGVCRTTLHCILRHHNACNRLALVGAAFAPLSVRPRSRRQALFIRLTEFVCPLHSIALIAVVGSHLVKSGGALP